MLPPGGEGCSLAAALAIGVDGSGRRGGGCTLDLPGISRASSLLDHPPMPILATPTGIEPVLTDRQSAVLTAERRSHEGHAGGGGRTRADGMGPRRAAATPRPRRGNSKWNQRGSNPHPRRARSVSSRWTMVPMKGGGDPRSRTESSWASARRAHPLRQVPDDHISRELHVTCGSAGGS